MKALTRSLIAIFACAVLTLTVFAGPEPIRDYKDSKTVVPVPPPCDWRGFYVGVTAGGTFADEDSNLQDYNTPSGAWSYDASGVITGLEVGYNFQPLHWLVVGLEADAGYLGLDGHGSRPTSPALDTESRTDDGFYTTFRARLGIASNHWLFYNTAGGIALNNEVSVFDTHNTGGAGIGLGHGSSDDFRLGWTAGGGVAYAFNCHWSIKAEYLYFDVGREYYRFDFSNPNTTGTLVAQTDSEGHIVRAGLDYKF